MKVDLCDTTIDTSYETSKYNQPDRSDLRYVQCDMIIPIFFFLFCASSLILLTCSSWTSAEVPMYDLDYP
jgi:hypothetical protein